VTSTMFLFRYLAVAVVALMLDSGSVEAQDSPRRVLLIYPFDNAHPATANAGAAIQKRLLRKGRLQKSTLLLNIWISRDSRARQMRPERPAMSLTNIRLPLRISSCP